MDQPTRRIIGISVHCGDVAGIALCRLFNMIVTNQGIPRYLNSDNDPLFSYHRWQANLRILDIQEIESVPYVPLSHPVIERLIGTIRGEFLDHVIFPNSSDLDRKLEQFRQYYNVHRAHTAFDGDTPRDFSGEPLIRRADLSRFHWKSHCRGLYQLAIVA